MLLSGAPTTVAGVQGELELTGLPKRLIRVTPARLNCWNRCPRQYRMTYVDRPTPSRGAPWAHNTVGAVVHLALRALFELPSPRRTPSAAVRLVTVNWQDDGFRDAGQSARMRGLAQQWVSDYVGTLDVEFEPVGVERWVSTPTKRIVAEGRVDRIDDHGGELVVVDYKTGRHALTVDDTRGSQALALYALAVRRTLRRPCNRVELHHLPTGEVLAWEHTEDSLRRHLDRAEESADELGLAADTLAAGGDAEVLFPPRPGPQCSWCDFRRHCAEGQLAAPDVEPWALLPQ